MKLSIITPAHNEEHRIRPMLDAYTDYFTKAYGDDFELIVVVNGSTDSTGRIIEEYSAKFPQVVLIEELGRIGKGGAIMLGFRAAKGELVGFVDADGSTPPAAYDDLTKEIGSNGAIIANRWLPESKVDPPQPLSRRIASRCFNVMVRTLFKINSSDTQCGAKLITREAMTTVLPRLGLTQWAFDVDLLFQLRRAQFSIHEVPTTWSEVGGSQLRIARVSFEMFLAICRLRILHSPLQWVVSIYDATIGRIVRTKA